MIRSISMEGIKSSNCVQELTGRDIIIGRNGSGKTTRLQALGIALLGYAPGGKKRPEEVFKLAHGDVMTVGIETDGLCVSREFSRDGLRINHEITLDPRSGEKTAKAKEQRIEGILGKLPLMLDFDEFLSLSDMKRREYIYNLAEADGGAWSAGRLKAILTAGLTPRGLSGDSDQGTGELVSGDIDDCLSTYREEDGIHEGLRGLHSYAGEQAAYWKKERDKAAGTADKMNEFKNDLGDTDRDYEQNAERLTGLKAELAKAISDCAEAKRENERRTRDNQRIARVKEEIDGMSRSENPADALDISERIAKLSAGIIETDSTNELRGAADKLEEAAGRIAETELTVREYDLGLQRLGMKKKSAESLLQKLSSHDGTCPLDSRIKCGNDFSELVGGLMAETEECRKEIAELNDDKAKVLSEQETLIKSRTEAERELERLRLRDRERVSQNERLRNSIRSLESELERAEMFESLKAERLKAKYAELESLKPTGGAEEWPLLQQGETSARKSRLEEDIAILEEKVSRQARIRNSLIDIKQSILDREAADLHLNIWKRIAELTGPKGLQGELIKNALSPLTDAVQDKLSLMGVKNAFFFQTEDDKGRELFQFGWAEADGERRSFDALSTGEQLLLLIALMTTIIERLNPPLKVLAIDNTEKLDEDNRRRVFSGLNAAGANMDNIILCGVMELRPEDAPGFCVWDLGGGI